MTYTQQSWNRQEAATVYLGMISATGSERERVEQKWRQFAGDFAATMTPAAALWDVQAYGGAAPDGTLNERGRGNFLTILNQSGNSLTLW